MQHSGHRTPQTISFLALPAELRLQIYKYAIPAMPSDLPYQNAPVTAPTTLAIRDISGFILSCRQIYHEVEHEVIECLNGYLTSARFIEWRDTRNLHAINFPVPTRFSETVNIHFDVSGLYDKSFIFGRVMRSQRGIWDEYVLICLLLNTFVSFTLDSGPYQVDRLARQKRADRGHEYSHCFDAVVLEKTKVMYARPGYVKPNVYRR